MTFRRLLVAVGTRGDPRPAVSLALRMTAGPDCELLLVHVCPPLQVSLEEAWASPDVRASVLEQGRALLALALEAARAHPRKRALLLEGDPAALLADVARGEDADLVVVGPPRGWCLPGVGATLLEQLVRRTGRPVLVASREAR